MEVRKGLGHLTQDEHFLMEGKLLLAVTLQVLAKTGLHLLHHEHWQPRFWLQVYAEELDYAGMTQLRPCQALRLKIADQFRYSSRRLVFQQDLVQALGSGRSAVPVNFMHGRICFVAEYVASEHHVRDDQSGEPGLSGSGYQSLCHLKMCHV